MDDRDDILAPDEQDEFGGLDGELGADLGSSVEDTPKEATKPLETVNPASDSQIAPMPSEGQIEAPTAIRKAKKASSVKKGKKTPKRRTMTKIQKAIRLVLRRSGRDKFPPLDDLMSGKNGKKVAINEIGIFAGTPKDALIAELAADCMLGNTLNFSAEITKLRTLQVGTQILKAGRMHSPIHVAQIKENGSLQCVSGGHRLAFLILAYGADSKIPVYLESMTLEEARDARGVANDSRPAKAKERAELAVLKAMKGKYNVNQAELYTQMATSKLNARKYGVYSVMERGYPLPLAFNVSATSSRKDGGLTTLSNVETFWSLVLDWNPEISQKEFDTELACTVKFINALAAAFQKNANFNPDYHMTTKPMTAIGKYYYNYKVVMKQDPITVVEQIADTIVGMGDVSRRNPDSIYDVLVGV
jgi:hypothetical protein